MYVSAPLPHKAGAARLASTDMADDDFDAMLLALTATRECIVCHALYTDVASLGRHECRRHTAPLQTTHVFVYGTSMNSFACCGVSPHPGDRAYRGRAAATGCLVCDHVSEPSLPDDVTLPYDRARILFGEHVRAERASSLDASTGLLTIHRRATRSIQS